MRTVSPVLHSLFSSWARKFFERRTTRLYSGCITWVETVTTTLFCIFVLVTSPTFSCRRRRSLDAVCCWSEPIRLPSGLPLSLFHGLWLQVPLAQDRLDPRNVLPPLSDLLQGVGLAAGELKLESKELLRVLAFFRQRFFRRPAARFFLKLFDVLGPPLHASPLSLPRRRTGHKLGGQGQLVAGQAHSLARLGLRHALHFEKNPARLHHRDPEFRRAFALSHARFRRLLGHRLVRKNADPELSPAFDEPRYGNPAGLDLPFRDPAGLERLQAKIPERQVRAAPRFSAAAPALLL